MGKEIKSIIINGETAIKPYFYIKNKKLHCRYSVDKCVLLSDTEEARIKEELNKNPANKQDTLKKNWNLLVEFVQKQLYDGIKVVDEFMQNKRKNFK